MLIGKAPVVGQPDNQLVAPKAFTSNVDATDKDGGNREIRRSDTVKEEVDQCLPG